MTILKNKKNNIFLKEIISLSLIFVLCLVPWLEFINSNFRQIDEIFNDNFYILITIYFFIITILYIISKIFFKNRPGVYYISMVGFNVWIFFQFNLLKSFLNKLNSGNFLWHFSSEISLFIILSLIILSIYFLNKKINLNFFILFYLILNFFYLSTILLIKVNNSNVNNEVKISNVNNEVKINKNKKIRFNSDIKNSPNIYYFLIDAMKPLNEFENFYNMRLSNFRNLYQNYDYEYYKSTANIYNWTAPVMTSFFYLEEEIYSQSFSNFKKNDKKLKTNIYQMFPELLKKEYEPKLLKELNELGYEFKWIGNYSHNCSETNFKYCLKNKKENYIDLYTLQAFLNKSPLIQILDNLIQIEFIQNNFNFIKLNSNALIELDNFITSNKNSISNLGPTFFFTHDMETHEPYFVDFNCKNKRFVGKYNLEGYKNSYLCVIKKISKIIKTIEKYDPDSIVIFQSDHSWNMSNKSESKYGKRNNIFTLIKNNNICQNQIPANPNNLNSIRYFIDCLKNHHK